MGRERVRKSQSDEWFDEEPPPKKTDRKLPITTQTSCGILKRLGDLQVDMHDYDMVIDGGKVKSSYIRRLRQPRKKSDSTAESENNTTTSNHGTETEHKHQQQQQKQQQQQMDT